MSGLRKTTVPFLASSAIMLATLGVQEDWGLSRVGSRGRTPISWIFTLASVSEEEDTRSHSIILMQALEIQAGYT